jgi:hypothetical protein
MREHALFFALLMPPEVAFAQRAEAMQFYTLFSDLAKVLDMDGPPLTTELKVFALNIAASIDPFVDYKSRMLELQINGKMHSLVWPSFFDHTRHEAHRWQTRMLQLSHHDATFDRREVATFWTEITEEHAQFTAHLLDPTEQARINDSNNISDLFNNLNEVTSDTTIVLNDVEIETLITAAEDTMITEIENVRDIESGHLKSIIDPRLADHNRRETLKFIDELRRAI